MSKKSIVVDIDGTLIDVDFIPTSMYGDLDWDLINEENENAPVFEWCKTIVSSLYESGLNIIFVTGRSSTPRIVNTTNRMLQRVFPNMPYEIYMRPAGDDIPSCLEIKQQIFQNQLKDREILLILEDRREIQNWLYEQGYACLFFRNPKNPEE